MSSINGSWRRCPCRPPRSTRCSSGATSRSTGGTSTASCGGRSGHCGGRGPWAVPLPAGRDLPGEARRPGWRPPAPPGRADRRVDRADRSRYLIEALAAERDYTALAATYEKRLAQVPPAEQRRILVELLAVPKVLDRPAAGRPGAAHLALDPETGGPCGSVSMSIKVADDVAGSSVCCRCCWPTAARRSPQSEWLRFAWKC